MLRKNLIWRDLPLRKRYAPWQHALQYPGDARQRLFLTGAALAVVPAVAVLPAWIYLVRWPRFSHAEFVAAALCPVLAISFALGVRKLILCLMGRQFDAITAFAFGVLLILFVLLVYDGVFLFALQWQRAV